VGSGLGRFRYFGVRFRYGVGAHCTQRVELDAAGLQMLTKLLLFYLLTFVFGNPFVALLVLVVLYLAADVRYLGWTRRAADAFWAEREIRELSRQVDLNPYNVAASSNLGRLLVQRGRYAEALAHLERAIDRMEDSPETNYYLGLALLHSGRKEEGERRIQKTLAINPRFHYGEPYFRWGESLLDQGRAAEAAAVLQKGVDIHSSSTEGWYLLGKAHQAQGRREDARDALNRAIESFRQSPAYKRRGERRFLWKARLALREIS